MKDDDWVVPLGNGLVVWKDDQMVVLMALKLVERWALGAVVSLGRAKAAAKVEMTGSKQLAVVRAKMTADRREIMMVGLKEMQRAACWVVGKVPRKEIEKVAMKVAMTET